MSESESPIIRLLAGELREIPEGLPEHTGFWLPAIALLLVVGAVVEGVDLCTVGAEMLLQSGVESSHVRSGVVAECDTALVADDDDPSAGTIEPAIADSAPGRNLNRSSGDVLAFGGLAIDDTVAIEEDVLNTLKQAFTGWESESREFKQMR